MSRCCRNSGRKVVRSGLDHAVRIEQAAVRLPVVWHRALVVSSLALGPVSITGGVRKGYVPRYTASPEPMPINYALGNLADALSFGFSMFCEILWALILGFALSAVVQAVVSKSEMTRLLPDDSPKSLAVASGLGAASSSCSYASVALARSLFRKGANFTAAMAFEIASTNLVIELGIIIALLLGWQFVVGEFAGGLLMIVLLAILFRVLLTRRLVEEARVEAEKGRRGSMEGHAEMDMSVDRHGSIRQRLRSPEGFTATANYFVMDWA